MRGIKSIKYFNIMCRLLKLLSIKKKQIVLWKMLNEPFKIIKL